MDTSTTPGFLMKALRGHTLADVTAIGITGTPVSMASRVPPLLYWPFCPRSTRVPSGNMMTQVPLASSALPCCTTLLNALARRLRSMWIMSSRPMDQPKNGTYSSSFLNT